MGLSMEMKKDISKEINCIIEETTQYDFPFLASQEKKKAIITEKKLYIEEKLRRILPESFPNEDILKNILNTLLELMIMILLYSIQVLVKVLLI